jgi:hypothetical protein
MAADAPSMAVDMPPEAVDMPPEAADMPSAAVDMAAEAEVVMVVDAGRFHHQLEVLAADSTRCRPLCYRSCGQTAGRRKPYCNL